MINNLKYYIWRFFEKVCKYFNILIVFSTRVGIKTMNGASFRVEFDKLEQGHLYYSNGSDLFLGPDFNKDEYTLLNCPLSQSPHVGLVRLLSQGESPVSSDYIMRYHKGTLDGRIGHSSISNYSYFFKINKKRIDEIHSGILEPIIVYEWKGRKYIQDGKHRAALSFLLNMEIPYFLIDGNFLINGVTTCMLRIAAKKNNSYSKHIHFFE